MLFSLKSYAQESLPDTLYMNKNYEITPQQQADIIRIIFEMDANFNGYIFKDFNKDGKLKKSGTTSKKIGKPIGIISYYYDNGNKESEGFMDGIKKGVWKEWYQNEVLKSEADYVYDEKRKSVSKIINYNDSIGNFLVVNGNGIYKEYYKNNVNGQVKETGLIKDFYGYGTWEGFHKDGLKYYIENYDMTGKLTSGISFDTLGNKYDYNEPGISPLPKDGFEGFYKKIGQSITYPKSARRKGIQGKVYVQFEVGKNGEIIEVKTIKGIGKECDEEAERMIKESDRWNSGMQRGQPVKVKMILPITFKLS